MPKTKRHRRNKYRSGLERNVAGYLTEKGIKFEFESLKVPFTQPAAERVYIPDFIVKKGRRVVCIIETKGKLDSDGRKKLLWVKEQHPNLKLKILFQYANNRIRKGSKTTYANWADKHGFEWAEWNPETGIPPKWLK